VVRRVCPTTHETVAATASLAIGERIVAELDGISIPTTRSARQKPAGLPAKAITEATPPVWRMT